MRIFGAFWVLSLALSPALHADARGDYLAAAAAQKAGQWAEAAQGYARVTAQKPDYAPGWKQLASVRYYLGDREGAVASADRYLVLQPSDTAFAAWADRLRAQLKLPPRATPAPSPMAPAPAPVATPEGLLLAAPPPGAEAEVVAPENAASLNQQAASGIVELEQHEAERSAQQMADEADAVLRSREPARPPLVFTLRLLGGWALGGGSFEHGEDVDSATTPSQRRYNGVPAGGGSGVAELGVAFNEHLELGLGVYPLLWDDSRKSSQTSTVTRSNSSEASAAFVPLMASLTWSQPLLPGFKALLGGGLGVIPATTVKVKSQTVQTYSGSLDVTTVDASLDYGLTPAWRLLAGGEWTLGPRLGLDLAAQILGAGFADAGGKADVQVTDQNGTLLGSAQGLAVSPQPLAVLSISFLAGLHLRF